MKKLYNTDAFSGRLSLVDVLRQRAADAPHACAFSFLATGDEVTARLTYAEFDRRARAVAVFLRHHCKRGDRALLLYPSGLDFLVGFFGCLYAEVVAVPAYPPRANESMRRLAAIVADADAHLALTTEATLRTSQQLTPEKLGDPDLKLIATDTVAPELADAWRMRRIPDDTLAFLQYTSGSTGQPKGVMLTHRNLVSNQHMIRHGLHHHTRGCAVASWLPLFHDMGLIGMAMQTLYLGTNCFLMPPAAFLQKPLRWLQLISRERIDTAGGPNFAYDLCVHRTTPEERAALDLSRWRNAFNGSEPVAAATLKRFAAAFACAGFKPGAFVPCYGLAEASLLVTIKRDEGRVPRVLPVDPARLTADRAVRSSAPGARRLVSSGVPAPGVHLAVVDPATRQPLPEGRVGEIWLRGPSVGLGYWQKPELNGEIFGARLATRSRAAHLRTGDLGFLRGGELFVTGRIKDVIILRGQNHYPQDFEATAQQAHADLRPHGSAAFAVNDGATEGVVLVQEVERTALRRLDVAATTAQIRAALLREHDVAPLAVVLVKPSSLPKTSSGKIQRAACRERFLANALDVVGEWRRDLPAVSPDAHHVSDAGISATADTAAAAQTSFAAPPLPGPPAAIVIPASARPDALRLQRWLAERVATALKIAPSAVDPHAPLQSLGLDSLAAVSLSGELAEFLDQPVAPTVVYDLPTIAQLAAHFSDAPTTVDSTTRRAAGSAAAGDDDRDIAIVGLGCRFPGAPDPDAFWELLRNGVDATRDIPADRWDVAAHYDPDPDAPGRMYVKRGAFLERVDGFDPELFGIAQRDAVAIDPQHRLLLEVAWEALENAGIAPGSAARRAAGVFVGVSFDDYARLAAHSGDAARIDAYSALGAARSLAAARISYHLGLQGPSLLVDTLCSSSLLAVHLAVQSLRAGECRLALAGGANLILSPETTIASCKLRALAPDGRCKTFDASADGYARGEGAGIVVLKRLRDALADGDPIAAVIRGTAVNHDGRSNGLTAPNALAQEALLRHALADAGAAPHAVRYVEAHGTGTVLGDPIEVQALGRVYGEGRAPATPLLLGAVKTNIGHLEAAAGIAGLIKTVLALRHGELPATLHLRTPNPYIPWDKLPLRVVDRPQPWPTDAALAGVSSFGLGGTNVHVLVAPPPPAPASVSLSVSSPTSTEKSLERPLHILAVSGHTAAAAAANARAWADHLERPAAPPLADLCHTANAGRDAFAHRLAVVGHNAADLAAKLRAAATTTASGASASASASGVAPGVAFLFTGQSSHYAGMARELHATHPAFRATLERCAELFRDLLPQPLDTALFADDETLLGETLLAQPAVFAIEVALGRLWQSWGIVPRAVFGHGLGEFAAACIAGVFSLEDGARLVAAKARLTERLPAGGAMFAAATSAEQLAPQLAEHAEVEFAAFDGPAATTLAGPAPAIARLVEVLVRTGVRVEHLPITRALHSRALDPLLDEFAAVARRVPFRAPAIPLVTCLHGRPADDEIVTPRYWTRQMREPVQFARGLETLARDFGCRIFLEVGPQPALGGLGQAVLPAAEFPGLAWLPSLRPRRPDWAVLLDSLGRLFTAGVNIDWSSFDRGYARRRLAGCPTYAFQRRRCWLETAPRRAPSTTTPADIPTYALQWQPAPLAPAAADVAKAPTTWLLLTPDDDLAQRLTTALAARGHALRRVTDAAASTDSPAAGLILAGLSVGDVATRARTLLAAPGGATRLWFVTRRALAAGHETAELDLDAAPLAGFARSFALEHPARWGGLCDLDEFAPSPLDAFVTELTAAGSSDDDVVAWRAGHRLVPRLVPHAAPVAAAPLRGDALYLITGGTGALGLAVAEFLVSRGARHLALLARRSPSDAASAQIARLHDTGATVHLCRGDVSNRADVARILTELAAGPAPLTGVFHAAGLAGFAPLTSLSSEAFAEVLAAKVSGARHLHELTRGYALEHFVLFSSIASVWGSHGQTHYAAANAHLDALAHERRRLGLPALSVNWGPWDGAGMVSAADAAQLRRLGVAPLAPAAAVALLGRLMAGNAVQVVAADVDWTRLRPALTLRRPQPLLDALAATPAAPAATERPRVDILRRLHAADATQRPALLADYLAQQLARVLGRDDAAGIDRTQGFFALGMDSLMAVELRNTLEADLELQLPATIAFDRANLTALHAELTHALFATAPVSGPALAAPARAEQSPPIRPSVAATTAEPIAVIGLGCRFPGGVASPAVFWEMLCAGAQGIGPVPPDRWPADAHYHPDPEHAGTMYVRQFGFVRGVELFDHAFFNIFPREAATMDPQQRLLLETAWEALESAGLAHGRLRGSATGTFVGVSNNDYAQLLLRSGDAARIDAYFGTGNALNAVAGRVAYAFGLRGPTLVTDTACSSSLVALHQACQSLRAGECETAIAAGVNLMLAPEPAIALSRARMLAPDGRCKTFDAAADGYGRGEGCGVVILQPLAAARAAGRPILAVIAGSAVNQDGASGGFTVPNGTAQQELIHRALAQAGRMPDELDYIEAHGTGTPLGDPIEINALAAVVGRARPRPLWVGSVKTNLGHLESAAGIAGVIKTVLALRHGRIPAHVNFSRPSPQIDWERLPVRVPTALTPWENPAGRPRLAGVSAFGFTGTNAHVILEAAPTLEENAPAPATPAPHLIPLSARTGEALLAQRARLGEWLDAHPDTSLADLVSTLGTGRTHFAIRETYLVASTDELRHALRAATPPPAPVPATPPPVAFVARSLAALSAAEFWRRAGISPAAALGEGPGLLAAGAIAGVFSASDAAALAHDSAALATLTLHPPRISLGHVQLGRIPDHLAASRAWWSAALQGAAPSSGEPLATLLSLELDAEADTTTRLRMADTLYRAGRELDWRVLSPAGRHLADAPTYAFQRRRHWVDTAAPAPRAKPRRSDPETLLGRRLALPGTREIRFATEYTRDAGFMAHHRLFGRMIASAAQQIALVISAADAVWKQGACHVAGLSFPRAILLGEDETRAVQLVLTPGAENAMTARVLSAPPAPDDEWLVHLQGSVAPGAGSDEPWSNVIATDTVERTHAEIYGEMARFGYTLGASFRWLRSVRLEAGAAIATLAPDAGTLEPDGYHLHPGLIDSCFQLVGLCAGVQGDELHHGEAVYIPAAIERVIFYRRPAPGPLTCHARLTEADHRRTHRIRGELRLLDATGALVCAVQGFEARRAPRTAILPEASAENLYRVAWRETTAPAEPAAPAAVRTFCLVDEPAGETTLGARLAAHGCRVADAAAFGDATDVVLFVDAPAETPHDTAAARLLEQLQRAAAATPQPRIWVVTRGAQSLDTDSRPPSLAAAAALGLARIAALEHPELRLVALDLEPGAPEGEWAAVERELLAETPDETQLAFRAGRRFAARFVPLSPAPTVGTTPARLAIGHYGNLDKLALQPVARPTLAPHEVEIEVRAAGLNFRDVLNALGLLQGALAKLGVTEAAQLPLGGECAGVVCAVGAGVHHLQPGDHVIAALATGSLGTHVAVDARFVVAKPAPLSFAESATLPVVYLTAFHALRTLAHVRPGERVLVHAGAGGVGLAAIHVARLLGAEVVATASPAKWPQLRALGVATLGHSRRTDYAREFAPVDVVLNSLVGDHIPASLDLLRPGGRFVEIGKLGIWTAAQVAARRADVRYLPFDLVELSRESPQVIGDALRALTAEWSSGRLPSLPLHTFPLADAAGAFRFMAQARHVGKIVLLPRPPAPQVRRDGVYLITGGLGGLGQALADWLSRAGAGTLVLAGRRPPTSEQETRLADWRARGTTVAFRATDLASPGAAAELAAWSVTEFGALHGVFHTAGVLDDGVFAQQTAARLRAVFTAKASAAWELHNATLAQPLDFFVLFSSLAAVLGSPGQATYAAANAALDALAHHRHRLGRPALSIDWGPWAEAGMSARLDERDRARLAALGLRPLATAAGLRGLADALGQGEPQVAVVDLDRRALVASLGRGRVPPLLHELGGPGENAAPTGALLAQLRAAAATDRAGFLVATLAARLKAVLGLAAGETLAPDRDLTSLGFDSLTAVELKGWIAGEFGVEVPMQQIAGLSLDGLAQAILADLQLGETTATAPTGPAEEATLHADAQLPADIVPAGRPPALGPPRTPLLTGATGFLGAFLLDRLLRTTDATVHCLVRARSADEGRARVRENLRSYGLAHDFADARVAIVPGDLAAPALGLDAAAFASLADTVDTIYHNGAWLNFFYPYAALKAANVLGTQEVLRLAVRGRPKPVHYVSTSGVFYSRHYRGQALPETDAAERCAGHALGYSQSKWVAERLVATAAARGLPVTIHRAPFITGHHASGVWNSDDFICRLVRGFIALGAMPELEATMDIVPVDYVAHAIVGLSQDPAAAGGRFHLCASGVVPWTALAGWLAESGYPVRREPYAEWLRRLPALRNTDHPLAPFLPLFLEKSAPGRPTVPEVFLQSAHARLDPTATAARLAGSGLPAPAIDSRLWRCYLGALHARGLLPAPATP